MTTDFDEIIFNQQYHSYSYRGRKLTSVSKTIAPLKPTQDWDEKARIKAIEDGISVEEVKAAWKLVSEKAMDKGRRVHEWIAKFLRDELPVYPDPFLALNGRLPEMDGFEKFWQERPGAGTAAVYVEWVVGDAELGIAGTIDAAILGAIEGVTHLFDWKTGKAFSTENRFSRLLAPFDDLDNCDLANYSLQLGLYRLLVERNTHFEMGDSYIVHLDNDGGYTVHKAMDLRARLLDWLEGR